MRLGWLALLALAGCDFGTSGTAPVADAALVTDAAPGDAADGSRDGAPVNAPLADAAVPDARLTDATQPDAQAPDASSTGTLTGTVTARGAQTIDLTAEGTSDWLHLGGPGMINRKVTGAGQLGFAVLGTGTVSNAASFGFTWADGQPTVIQIAPLLTGIDVPGLAHGFSITAPAGAQRRHLAIYLAGRKGRGHMSVTLSDLSGSYDDTSLSSPAGDFAAVYRFDYVATATGTLTATFVLDQDQGGAVDLYAATLQ